VRLNDGSSGLAWRRASPLPDILPLEFLLAVMRDPNVTPELRVKVAQAAAPFCHIKPMGAPTDPAEGAKIIDAADRARIDEHLERLRELELKNLLGDDLSPDEQAELRTLEAREAALPVHLKPVLDPDEQALQDLLDADHERPANPQRQRTYEDLAEHRQRLLSDRHAILERRAPPLGEGDDALE
jgi:hypothetical protein